MQPVPGWDLRDRIRSATSPHPDVRVVNAAWAHLVQPIIHRYGIGSFIRRTAHGCRSYAGSGLLRSQQRMRSYGIAIHALCCWGGRAGFALYSLSCNQCRSHGQRLMQLVSGWDLLDGIRSALTWSSALTRKLGHNRCSSAWGQHRT